MRHQLQTQKLDKNTTYKKGITLDKHQQQQQQAFNDVIDSNESIDRVVEKLKEKHHETKQ